MDNRTRRVGRLLALALAPAIVLVVPAPASAQQVDQWWKRKPDNRLEQRFAAPSGEREARIKWDGGFIEARAEAGADPAIARTKALARLHALRAARQLAYLELAERIEGVAIDGVTLVKNAMVVDQTVRSTVQAKIRGAVVVGESVTELSDGSVLAEVVVRLPLRGAGGITGSLTGFAASRPADPYRPNPAVTVSEPYTGVIVEASDSGFSLAAMGRLIEEGTGKLVYGPHMIQAAPRGEGPVGFAPAVDEARRSGRIGPNPLIVRAVGAGGATRGDLILSRNDAERVLAAERASGVLGKAAVVVVLGKERSELRAGSGRRHALVVGVSDYRQNVPGAFPRLTYAASDARALAGVLGRSADGQGTVTVLQDRDATREKILEALVSLRGSVSEHDTLVLFFAGHGSIGRGDDGQSHYYLVPHDGQLTDLGTTALRDDRLEEALGNIPARQVVVILDACFSGGGAGLIRARGVTNPAAGAAPAAKGLIEASAGRVVISASKPDQVAWEDDQRRSGLLTSVLLDGLAGKADLNNDGAITAIELYQYALPLVRDYSRQHLPAEQTPVLEVRSLSDEIVLARR